jgi:hypothetical protein
MIPCSLFALAVKFYTNFFPGVRYIPRIYSQSITVQDCFEKLVSAIVETRHTHPVNLPDVIVRPTSKVAKTNRNKKLPQSTNIVL